MYRLEEHRAISFFEMLKFWNSRKRKKKRVRTGKPRSRFNVKRHTVIFSRHIYSMVHYDIKQYTLDQAKKHGYVVNVSKNTKKKLDVFKDNIKIGSIGNSKYKDFPTYIQENGLEYAKVKRALYRNRHKKDIKIKGSNGWLSSILLW